MVDSSRGLRLAMQWADPVARYSTMVTLLALLATLIPSLPSLKKMTHDAAKDVVPVAPHCFAYAPKLHAFACVGHAAIYNMNHVGADDQATNIAIDIIGPTVAERWTIAAIGGRATTSRATVEKRLAALGMKPLRTQRVRIEANAWVSSGAETLFLRVSAEEGDASFENVGELTLRCSTGADVKVDLRGAGIELGETAVAWRVNGILAFAIAGLDGGEDTSDFLLDTAVIDVETTCKDKRAALWTLGSAAQ
jgi:hypothetical protein